MNCGRCNFFKCNKKVRFGLKFKCEKIINPKYLNLKNWIKYSNFKD